MEEGFWDDIDNANQVNKELTSLKKIVNRCSELDSQISDNLELLNMLDDSDLEAIKNELPLLQSKVDELSKETLLSGPFDNLDCYLEIHPGAGGTESCDWASMLLRMYELYFTHNGYKYEIIDKEAGDEAGIKSVTLKVSFEYAYGYLKREKGVHRLVRISPFDSAGRRHTSFASVLVTPIFNKDIDIEVKESDLKIDVYHSSGAGGQSVNTSNSAVRITHIPSKIVVTCQNERSQLRNKEEAIKMLKSKLYEMEIEKKEAELNKIKGENVSINFGSQIRNYVLYPYKLVKDLRSGYETSNADRILDGDISELLDSLLKC